MANRILIQKNEKAMVCLQEPLIVAASKADIFFEHHQIDKGIGPSDDTRCIINRCIVDNDDLHEIARVSLIR